MKFSNIHLYETDYTSYSARLNTQRNSQERKAAHILIRDKKMFQCIASTCE
jgi:hypothetical protein